MPSRADGVARRAAEWVLHVIGLALVALLFVRTLHAPSGIGAATARSDARSLGARLPAWTVTPTLREVDVALEAPPAPVERDWLAALARAGVDVRWTNESIAPVAIAATALADPAGGYAIDVATAPGRRIVIRDALGALDTLSATSGGIHMLAPWLHGEIVAADRNTVARAPLAPAPPLRRLLVEGSAGWETKFAIAALQERGWHVDALTHVAPGIDVRVGEPVPPDTARYAAVVLVDTSAALATRGLDDFVRAGGGLVTLHDAAGLGPEPVRRITLERDSTGDVVAGRVGDGRVVRIGYPDLWRRRMRDRPGIVDPAAAERAWLARVVASASSTVGTVMSDDADAWRTAAPLAALVDRLGAPRPSAHAAGASSSRDASTIPGWFLLLLALAAFGGEWLSRRLRGAR